MFGKNPIRKPEKGMGEVLQVQHIFPTIQGEGPFAGAPSVFVRLGGCNLQCRFCDTEFENFRPMGLEEIWQEIERLKQENAQTYPHPTKLVVVTGGEPFRQNIAPLCDMLVERGMEVQIETNGTLYRPVHKRVNIVCSPKAVNGRYAPLREDILARANALKFILSESDAEYDHVPDVGQGRFHTPVYVQAMDEYDAAKNARNKRYAVEIAAKEGYKLSIQTHKMLGVE